MGVYWWKGRGAVRRCIAREQGALGLVEMKLQEENFTE